jgi:hypothetical protein
VRDRKDWSKLTSPRSAPMPSPKPGCFSPSFAPLRPSTGPSRASRGKFRSNFHASRVNIAGAILTDRKVRPQFERSLVRIDRMLWGRACGSGRPRRQPLRPRD